MNLFLYRNTTIALGNIGWHRDNGSAQLVTQGILLYLRELVKQIVNPHHKLSSIVPYPQFLELELKSAIFFAAKLQYFAQSNE